MSVCCACKIREHDVHARTGSVMQRQEQVAYWKPSMLLTQQEGARKKREHDANKRAGSVLETQKQGRAVHKKAGSVLHTQVQGK
jgi:hypothetical protein